MSDRIRMNPVMLFILAQVIAGCAVAIFWLNLKNPLPDDPSVWPFWTGIICVTIPAVAIFLADGKKDSLRRLLGVERISFQGVFLFLFSFLPAVLIGVTAKEIIPYYMKSHQIPSGGLIILFSLCVGLPFLVIDLNLLIAGNLVGLVNKISIWLRLVGNKTDGWGIRLLEKSRPLFRKQPWIVSLFITILYFIFIFSVFRVGYETNDDISMISIASGYLGGAASPVLVFSNVILGFFLNFLYGMQTRLNWEILLFILINFLSAWSLILLVFSALVKPVFKLIGLMVILLCDAYFLIRINFTTIPAFASIAGLSLLLTAVLSHSPVKKLSLIGGISLLLVSSLIRFESVLLILLMIIPALIIFHRSFQFRILALAFIASSVLVAGCNVFDRMYVNSNPAWQSYSLYNQARSSLQDTPRSANLWKTYDEVGWSENDFLLFKHWFFPDRKVYSIENLQYLVEHTPVEQADLVGTLDLLVSSLSRLISLPYIFVMVAVWLGMLLCVVPAKKVLMPSFIVVITSLAILFYLSEVMKIPYRVMLPVLSANAIFGLFIFLASIPGWNQGMHSRKDPGLFWMGVISMVFSFVMASGLVLAQMVMTSRTNMKRQAAYQQITSDLKALQEQGTILPNALIVSPAYGVPLEWSNPLVLDFPEVQYLNMGWLTFSPPYEETLQDHQVSSLPAGLYQNDNVYLMVIPSRMEAIRQFITDHEGVEVDVSVLYEVPEIVGEPAYDQVRLYKLEPSK